MSAAIQIQNDKEVVQIIADIAFETLKKSSCDKAGSQCPKITTLSTKSSQPLTVLVV
jgi:hypothetical protein